jgi:predicted transcriptional regulator
MKLRELTEKLNVEVRTGADQLDREVKGGYAGDLLSDVMAHSRAGDVWITLQTHENTIAVAGLKDLAAIILVGGREPDHETYQRAKDEGIPILISPDRTFEVVGYLTEGGVPRRAECT